MTDFTKYHKIEADEGGWDGPLHDAIAPTLPEGIYGLELDGSPNIEDAS